MIKITNRLIIFILIGWLILGFIGMPYPFLDLYNVQYYDKLVHFISGIFLALLFSKFNYRKNAVIGYNLIIAIAWEFGQLAVSQIWPLTGIGFPDGYGDILAHMIGTILVCIFVFKSTSNRKIKK